MALNSKFGTFLFSKIIVSFTTEENFPFTVLLSFFLSNQVTLDGVAVAVVVDDDVAAAVVVVVAALRQIVVSASFSAPEDSHKKTFSFDFFFLRQDEEKKNLVPGFFPRQQFSGRSEETD